MEQHQVDSELFDAQGEDYYSKAQHNLKALKEMEAINHKLKAKTAELEKARAELDLSDKDARYKLQLKEGDQRLEESHQQTLEQLEAKHSRQMEELEDVLRNKKRSIESQKSRIDSSIDDLKKKIAELESRKDALDEKMDEEETSHRKEIRHLAEKHEEQKSKKEAIYRSKKSYYDSELQRLYSDSQSTPKTRALEFDLLDLWEQLNKAEKQFYGEEITLRKWNRALPSSLQQEVKQKQNPQPVVKPQTCSSDKPSDPVTRPETPPHTCSSDIYQPPLTTVKQMPVFELPRAKEIVKEIGFSLADEEEEEEHQKARTSEGQIRFPKIIQSSKLKKKVIPKK